MTRLIAPILSFTAEEVWQYLPSVEGRLPSVHLALFPSVLDVIPGRMASLEMEWEQLIHIRQLVMVELEALRLSKSIGKSLDASVRVIAAEGSADAVLLKKYESALAEFFNVSEATVQLVGATKENETLLIEAGVANGAKCERCWRVVPDVGADGRWPTVCTRCAEALNAIGFPPLSEEAA
jgi:isoleucyl-tRNA synthetase